jgi:selenocysteine lyase/cysteine desulfurase
MLYLDHASTSYPKDPRVVAAVAEALVEPGVAPDRGHSARGRESARILEQARARVAELLSVPSPERVTLALNATDALNLAIKGLVADGDEVVLTQVEHNSVVRPLHGLAKRRGVRLAVAPADARGVVRAEDVLELVTPRTRLVVMAHASNVTGALQPVAAVGRALRSSKGAPRLLVDVAQSAGYRPLDEVAEVTDLIAGAGHKGPGGPLGTGFLWTREGVTLASLREGGTGVKSEEPLQPTEYPGALEAGSPNVPGIAGLSQAIALRLEGGGLEAIAAARRAIGAEFLARAKGIEGVTVHGPSMDAREPVFPIRVRGLSVAEAAVLLEQRFGIEQRAGLHCAPGTHVALGTAFEGTLRLSFGARPASSEVDAAATALRELAAAGAEPGHERSR